MELRTSRCGSRKQARNGKIKELKRRALQQVDSILRYFGLRREHLLVCYSAIFKPRSIH